MWIWIEAHPRLTGALCGAGIAAVVLVGIIVLLVLHLLPPLPGDTTRRRL